MKKHNITSAIAATALLLPIAAYGQSSGSGSSTSGSSSTPTSSQYPTTSATSPTTGASGSLSSPSTANQSWGTSSHSSANIQTIQEKQLEKRVTASNLMGKEVKDRDGKKLGKVKDIGLSQAFQGGSSMSHASMGSSSTGLSGSTSTSGTGASAGISGNVGGTGASASVGAGTTGATGASGTYGSTGTTSGVSTPSYSSSAMGQSQQGGVNVFISMDDLDDGQLVSIPASELRYDQEKKELSIQRSKSEITQIAQSARSMSSSTAAE